MQNRTLSLVLVSVSLFTTLLAAPLYAATTVKILPTRTRAEARDLPMISDLVKKFVRMDGLREVRAQLIHEESGGRHILVHMHSAKLHRVDFASMSIDAKGAVAGIRLDYKLTRDDEREQVETTTPKCPDEKTQVITFAPNENDFELGITKDVTAAARTSNFVTKELLTTEATRQNYLNYMSCPQLRGNFYDGDANPEEIVTSDGFLTAKDLSVIRSRFEVTNIWLACEAFNDPMRTTMLETTQSRKYAAGINDLQIGPSDTAARCAMIEAMSGKPMTAAFAGCTKQFDIDTDHWGYDGKGSDQF